jgi:hypothetical protein
MDRTRSHLNNSPSKQSFSFSKSGRFGSFHGYTNAFGYEIPGQFGKIKGSGAKNAFGTS